MDYSQRTGQMRSGRLSDNRRNGRQRGLQTGRGSGGNRYQLKSRNIRFRGKGSAGMTRFAGLNMRTIVMAALGVVQSVAIHSSEPAGEDREAEGGAA